MRFSALIFFSTLISSVSLANTEDQFYQMLSAEEMSTQSETAVIQEQIAHFEKGEPRNPLAKRPKGPTRRLPGTSEATVNEGWVINSHQDLYGVVCAQRHLSGNCSKSGSAAAHRDLNAIQETMTLPELKKRLQYLQTQADALAKLRYRQVLTDGLKGALLSWDAVPSQSKAKYVVPTHFAMVMPFKATTEQARTDKAGTKKLNGETAIAVGQHYRRYGSAAPVP